MIDALSHVFENDPRINYALLFGSAARDTSHAHSDVDIAIGVTDHNAFNALAHGELTSRLEAVTNRSVHLVLLEEAPPGLSYRVFRDGRPLFIRDRAAFRARLARAILEYLDFKPVEDVFTHQVLRARHGR